MQKTTILIYVLLVIAAIFLCGIIIGDVTDKGKNFLQSLPSRDSDPIVNDPVVDIDTTAGYQDSTALYSETESVSTFEVNSAIIADTLITGNPSTDCLKELYGKDIMKRIAEGSFTPPADAQQQLRDCMESKLNSSKNR